MSNELEVITRGTDSSGRPLRGTRQMFECFDRCNTHLGGKLVPVQGAFNKGVSASAGTHDLAGCWDIRTWNLTHEEILKCGRWFRDHAAAYYYRTTAEGFDPHGHLILLSDAPMTPETGAQKQDYIIGRNALATHYADTFPYRPRPLVLIYDYLGETDMADSDEILRKVDRLLEFSRKQWAAERGRDETELKRLAEFRVNAAKRDAALADQLSETLRQSKKGTEQWRTTRTALRTVLRGLKDNPDTEPADTPSDEALAELESEE